MIINAGKYNIIIERGILSNVGNLACEAIKPCRAVIVSDDNVFSIYGETLKNSLSAAGFDLGDDFVFQHGEEQKSMTTLEKLLNHLAKEQLTRTDAVFALGGGVVGDLTGFAAAVYLRGIKHIQIPTSLLASVDSSVGGKTAVNLAYGKNLAGAFHEPSLVICDPNALSTLSSEYFSDGMAEVIKYGMINDPVLFNRLYDSFDKQAEDIISMCVTDKRDIVAKDLYDKGERQKLNLGHTIGHSIEALSGFSIHHGHAVASGMHIITKATVKMGMCDQAVLKMLDEMLIRYSLDPNICDKFSAKNLYEVALHDKKKSGSKITLVIPLAIGNSQLIEYPAEKVLEIIHLGTEKDR